MTCEQRIPVRWTDDEDRTLRNEVFRIGIKDWNHIATKLPGRTNKDCRKRWSKIAENVNKGTWSMAEDQLLKQAVAKWGTKWASVASVMQTRHADQCSKRWYHYLDPSLNHKEWTETEDVQLIKAVGQHGRKWAMIREVEFPGRSTTDIKNRHVIIERRARQALETGSVASIQDLHDHLKHSRTASSCSRTGTPRTPEHFNTPSTPELEAYVPPWTSHGTQGEEYFTLTPEIPTIDPNQQHFMSPWDSNTESIYSSTAEPWGYDQIQVNSDDSIGKTMQNLDYRFGGLMDWSSVGNADTYYAPQETYHSPFGAMVLENVQPEIVSRVMSVLIESNSPVKIRLCR